jgi:hypothetical protein
MRETYSSSSRVLEEILAVKEDEVSMWFILYDVSSIPYSSVVF